MPMAGETAKHGRLEVQRDSLHVCGFSAAVDSLGNSSSTAQKMQMIPSYTIEAWCSQFSSFNEGLKMNIDVAEHLCAATEIECST